MPHCSPPAIGLTVCGGILFIIGFILMRGAMHAAEQFSAWHIEDQSQFDLECTVPGDLIMLYRKKGADSDCDDLYSKITVDFAAEHSSDEADYDKKVSVSNGCHAFNYTDIPDATSPDYSSDLMKPVATWMTKKWFGPKPHSTGKYEKVLTNKPHEPIQFRRLEDQSEIDGFELVASFSYYSKTIYNETTNVNTVTCIEGKYTVKSPENLYAVEWAKKVGEALLGLMGLLAAAAGYVALVCCGGCLALCGCCVFLASSPPVPMVPMAPGQQMATMPAQP